MAKKETKEIACMGFSGDYKDRCKFDDVHFCKNPDCLTPVLPATEYGKYPKNCPVYNRRNSRKAAE